MGVVLCVTVGARVAMGVAVGLGCEDGVLVAELVHAAKTIIEAKSIRPVRNMSNTSLGRYLALVLLNETIALSGASGLWEKSTGPNVTWAPRHAVRR